LRVLSFEKLRLASNNAALEQAGGLVFATAQ